MGNNAHNPLSPATPTTVPASGRASSTLRKKPRHLEDDLQAVCVRWFRLQYAQLGSLLFAIPNGGHRNPREAARLKAQGVTAGVPDLLLAIPVQGAAGLFLELKVGKNKASPLQHAMLDKLEEYGYTARIIYSFDAFQQAVRRHLGY